MKKQYSLRKAMVPVLALGILSANTSCSSMSDGTTTQVQGTALGTLGGAAVGALAGLAIGGNTKSVITGLAVGAAAGAVAGFVWGNSVVKQKKAYATTEQYVQANNAQLSNRINQTRQYNQKLSKQVASLKAQNKKLSQQEKKNAQQGIAYINQDITTARDAMKDATGSERAELSSKINTLNEEKAMMARLAEL